jgi:hypothetical protein
MLTHAKRTYALKEFTVELRPKGWYFWRTYGDRSDTKGPYSSINSVTLMVARELVHEIAKREAIHKPSE